MTKPKWLIPRRHVLRGAGVCLALPVMEAMFGTEREALAGMGRPKRYVFFGSLFGYQLENFRPTGGGSDMDLTRNPWGFMNGFSALEPLDKYRDDVLVVSGLGLEGSNGRAGGSHVPLTFLYGTHSDASHKVQYPYRRQPDTVLATIDQLIADKIGTDTPFKSVQLGTDIGLGTPPYTFSYRDNGGERGVGLYAITDPKVVFDQILAGVVPTPTDDPDLDAIRRFNHRTSVLDGVLDQGTTLRARLGKADRLKLDEYLAGLRDVEKRLVDPRGQGCESGAEPTSTSDPTEIIQRAQELMAMVVLMFKCDLTRVVTFTWGEDSTGITYRKFLAGINKDYHTLSHSSFPVHHDQRAEIDRYRVEQFVSLIDGLAEATDPDGKNMLESSLVLFGNEHGGNHYARTPAVLVGHGNGAITPGRHLEFDDGYERALDGGPTPSPIVDARGDPSDKLGHYTDLLLAILETADVQVPKYGLDDRTTPLPGLKI